MPETKRRKQPELATRKSRRLKYRKGRRRKRRGQRQRRRTSEEEEEEEGSKVEKENDEMDYVSEELKGGIGVASDDEGHTIDADEKAWMDKYLLEEQKLYGRLCRVI